MEACPPAGGREFRVNIKGVLFDLEGVLMDSAPADGMSLHMKGVRQAYDFLLGLGVELPDFPRAFGIVHAALSAAKLGLVFGNCREIDIEKEIGGILASVAPGIGKGSVTRAIDLWFEPFAARFAPASGADRTLRELRRAGIRTRGCANTPWPARLVLDVIARGPLAGLLDGITLSSEAGLRRPNLFFFESALESMGLDGTEVAYAGSGEPGSFEAAEEKRMLTIGVGCAANPDSMPRIRAGTVGEIPRIIREGSRSI